MTRTIFRSTAAAFLASSLLAALANCGDQPSPSSAPSATTSSTTPTSRDAAGYPQTTLANASLTLTVYLPDKEGFYRGPRFDWSGMISHVEFRGHSLFAPRHTPHVPTLQDNAFGTAEEFGMDTAVNFSAVEPGQPFLKIGVGAILRPKSGKYDFQSEYPVATPAPWTTTTGKDFAESTQTQPPVNGWAFTYTKRIELLPNEPGWAIIHTLTNTGTHDINTSHYCHNFLIVDNLPIGPGYSIEYPAPPQIQKNSLTQDSISIHNNTIQLDKPLAPRKPIWAPLSGLITKEPYRMTLRESSTGLQLDIKGDRPLTKAVLYAEPQCLCPEAFIDLHIPPNKTETWRTEYHLKITK